MKKIVIKVQWLIVTILWIYIFYRAVFISITQDEAYSYFLVKTNYWRAMPGSLNTHWLNTLAMRLFLWLPGADHAPYLFAQTFDWIDESSHSWERLHRRGTNRDAARLQGVCKQ